MIVAPDGSIVQDSFVIGPGQIWSNICAFNGGFCVRLNGILMFYDNSGTLLGLANQSDAPMLAAVSAAAQYTPPCTIASGCK